jgi:hypothetical protein
MSRGEQIFLKWELKAQTSTTERLRKRNRSLNPRVVLKRRIAFVLRMKIFGKR